MKTSLRSLSLVLALQLVGHVPFLRAQAVAPVKAAAAPVVSMTFNILLYGNEGPPASYLAGGRYVPVNLVPSKRSPAYNYVGPADMVFYASSSVKAPGGTPTVVARAPLPANLKHALLVFVAGGDGYSVGVLPDDPQTLPFGKARIYNASSTPVSVTYNFTTTVVLKPQESKVIDPDKGLVAVEVSVPAPDGKWVKQVNNGWQLTAAARREIFILNGESFQNMGLAARAVQMFSQEENKPAAR